MPQTPKPSPVPSEPGCLQRLVRQLKALDALVPKGEGAVVFHLFADMSWKMSLNLWGVTVANRPADGQFLVDVNAVHCANPQWLVEVIGLVEKLNKLLPNKPDEGRPSKPSTPTQNV